MCHSHEPHGITQTDELEPVENEAARRDARTVSVSALLEVGPVPVHAGFTYGTWAEDIDETGKHREREKVGTANWVMCSEFAGSRTTFGGSCSYGTVAVGFLYVDSE